MNPGVVYESLPIQDYWRLSTVFFASEQHQSSTFVLHVPFIFIFIFRKPQRSIALDIIIENIITSLEGPTIQAEAQRISDCTCDPPWSFYCNRTLLQSGIIQLAVFFKYEPKFLPIVSLYSCTVFPAHPPKFVFNITFCKYSLGNSVRYNFHRIDWLVIYHEYLNYTRFQVPSSMPRISLCNTTQPVGFI